MSRSLRLLTLATLAGAFLRLYRLTAVPPGLHYDLAATALLGNDIAFGGARPVFISAYTGHEVLFYYWLAAWFRLVGSSVFTLRVATAMLGVLAIPCAYFAARQVVFADRHPRRVAALAAILLSFAFFHVTFSRFGFRVISEPVTQSLALGFLWRGLRRSGAGRRAILDIALGGAFTGLTAYTYLAARLFPFPIAIALLALWILDFRLWIFDFGPSARRAQSKIQNPQSAIRHPPSAIGRGVADVLLFLLSAAVVFAPLGWFFYQHPEALLTRATQLAPRGGEAGLMLYGVRRALEMIFIDGEPYDRFNIPGRPLFGPLLGAAFVLGLLITLRRAWRRRAPLARASEVLLLAWLPLMLLPTALAVHDIFPSNVRAFGLIPLLFVFPARGIDGVASWVAGRLRANGPGWTNRTAFSWLAGAAVVFGTLTTGHAYFNVWANLPNQYMNNEADLASAARWLNARDTSGDSVYVSSYHYRHPALAYLARDYASIHSIYQAGTLPVPEAGPVLYVFPRSAPPPGDWTVGWEAFLIDSPLGPDGTPDFWAYRFSSSAEVPLPDFDLAQANFGNIAELTGFALRSATVGGDATVDLRWRVLNVPEIGDFRAVADWVDAWGHHWSQGANDAYPSEQWSAGDTLITRLRLPLPAGLPPGTYSLAVTLFSPNAQQTLPALGPNGEFAGAMATVGPIVLGPDVPRDPSTLLQPAVSLNTMLGELTLVGIDPAPQTVRPGERLGLALYWQSDAAASGDYIPRITLASTSRSLVLSETDPVRGTFPTRQWSKGQAVVDRYSLRLPRDLEPGAYRLSLDLLAPDGGPVGGVDLGPIEVQPVARSFEPPPSAHPLDVTLGDLIQLTGLDLSPEAPLADQPFTLTLHWRALAETEADYTAFVHLLDSSGAVVAQHDAPPRDGGYPTSLWAEGEHVSESHTLTLPPGDYTVEVGFYLPESGQDLGRANVFLFTIPGG